MAALEPAPELVERLKAFYLRNGYVRPVDAKRRKKKGRVYKKGSEIRLVANTKAELAEIRRVLRQAGFKPARSWVKALQWRQPVYGVTEVTRFMALIGEPMVSKKKNRPVRRRTPKASAVKEHGAAAANAAEVATLQRPRAAPVRKRPASAAS